MTTKLEKTAAFLQKLSAEQGEGGGPGFLQRNWLGFGDQTSAAPFAQPPVDPTEAEVLAEAYKRREDPASASVLPGLAAARRAADRAGAEQIDPATVKFYSDKLGMKPKEHGFIDNYTAALKRGHTGTVLATGGAALLAGVLAYNFLKRKKQPKVAAEQGEGGGPGFLQRNWLGFGDQTSAAPFAQPPVDPTEAEVLAEAYKSKAEGRGEATLNSLGAARNSAYLAGTDQLDPVMVKSFADALGMKPKERGFIDNYTAALKRGHTGTVLATGGAALLAGVLAYNLLKRKKQSKVAASVRQIAIPLGVGAAGVGGGYALGRSLGHGDTTANPEDSGLVDKAVDKTKSLWGDYTGALKGEKGTAAQVGTIAGTAAVASIPLYLLYRKLRGNSD